MSRYLRSGCCGAPVMQGYEAETNLFPIRCAWCWQELAAPGMEDVPDALMRRLGHVRFGRDLLAFKLGEMIAARVRPITTTWFRLAGL
ncbi:MAG: hypothetical protein ACJ72N_06935 [Labedaea sp.]